MEFASIPSLFARFAAVKGRPAPRVRVHPEPRSAPRSGPAGERRARLAGFGLWEHRCCVRAECTLPLAAARAPMNGLTNR
jgi:hypothetical protein